MNCTFLHTADWQLGKPFAFVQDPAKRALLQQRRIDVVRELGQRARDAGARFVLVAGDLFDSAHVTRATVSAACDAIGSIGLPVLVIPGNHDHGGPGAIWMQDFFKREQAQLAPNLQVLLERVPVILDQAVIFPAPLLRRHEPGDPSAWIREAASSVSLPEGLLRIVLAHGSVQRFGSDAQSEEGVSNWIDLDRLPAEEIDYMALGDWHGARQVGAKAWYSGTPEIDRFPKGGGNDPGNALIVTAERGAAPRVEKISTGALAWSECEFQFSADEGVEELGIRLDVLSTSRGLLHLVLRGSLGVEAGQRLDLLLESWEARLLHLSIDREVSLAPSPEEISALTGRTLDPLIATVARRLSADLSSGGDGAEVAALALRELHRITATF